MKSRSGCPPSGHGDVVVTVAVEVPHREPVHAQKNLIDALQAIGRPRRLQRTQPENALDVRTSGLAARRTDPVTSRNMGAAVR